MLLRSFWWSLAIHGVPWIVVISFRSLLLAHLVFFSMRLHMVFIEGKYSLDLGSILIQYDLILTKGIYKNPTFR